MPLTEQQLGASPHPFDGRTLDELADCEAMLQAKVWQIQDWLKSYRIRCGHEDVPIDEMIVAHVEDIVELLEAQVSQVKEAEAESPEARAEHRDRMALLGNLRARQV